MLAIVKLFFAVLLADFVSGFIHWLEDTYAKPGMPFIHQIAVENELHHEKPRAFLAKSWWQSSWDSVLAVTLLVAIVWYAGFLSWPVVLFAVLAANANQLHKWTHQNAQEKPRIVTRMQKWNILQTCRHHAKHHSGDKNTHYCVVTNILNPVLERMNFWRTLEHMIAQLRFKTA